MKLVIRDLSQVHWINALLCAQKFQIEYPDRMGFHQCVFYTLPEIPTLIVYRTKTSIIVRGT